MAGEQYSSPNLVPIELSLSDFFALPEADTLDNIIRQAETTRIISGPRRHTDLVFSGTPQPLHGELFIPVKPELHGSTYEEWQAAMQEGRRTPLNDAETNDSLPCLLIYDARSLEVAEDQAGQPIYKSTQSDNVQDALIGAVVFR